MGQDYVGFIILSIYNEPKWTVSLENQKLKNALLSPSLDYFAHGCSLPEQKNQ